MGDRDPRLRLSDASTVTLPSGTYTLDSRSNSNSNRVTLNGPVTLNIATNLCISAAQMLPQGNDPKYLAIYPFGTCSAGSASVTHSNLTRNFHADLNALTAYTPMNRCPWHLIP